MRKTLYLLPLIIIFIGCGQPDYTIISDPVWIESWQKGEGGSGLVKALEKETGKNISFMPGELTGDRGYIEEILSRAKGETVILSPLFSGGVDPQMSERAGKKTVLLSFTERKKGNFSVPIRMSRLEAFRKAGETCARMLLEEPDVYGNRAAAVFYTAIPRRREEMEMFKSGFTGIHSPDKLKIFEITTIDDRKSLRPFLDELKRSNTKLVLLAASRLNIFGIEECARENCRVILEEGSGFEAFQEYIAGSIEIDQFLLLKTAVSIPFEEAAETVVEADFVWKSDVSSH